MDQKTFNEFIYEFGCKMMSVTSHLESHDVIDSLEALKGLNIIEDSLIDEAVSDFINRENKDFEEWKESQVQEEIKLQKAKDYSQGFLDSVFDKKRGIVFEPTIGDFSADYIAGYNKNG